MIQEPDSWKRTLVEGTPRTQSEVCKGPIFEGEIFFMIFGRPATHMSLLHLHLPNPRGIHKGDIGNDAERDHRVHVCLSLNWQNWY